MIYDYKMNGRAKRAVRSVVKTLRVYVQETNTPSIEWYWKWPMALWGRNDLPGAIAPYSSHRLLLGRDLIGFGDMLRAAEEARREDALDSFQSLGHEREEVKKMSPPFMPIMRKYFKRQTRQSMGSG